MPKKQTGRPKEITSLNKVLSASVTLERRKRIHAIAQAKDVTISSILNSALDLYLAKLDDDK